MTQTSHSDAIFELTMTEVEARHVQTGIGLFLIQPHPYVDTSKYHREIAVGLYRQLSEWIVERPAPSSSSTKSSPRFKRTRSLTSSTMACRRRLTRL